jgi:hypothetical protein
MRGAPASDLQVACSALLQACSFVLPGLLAFGLGVVLCLLFPAQLRRWSAWAMRAWSGLVSRVPGRLALAILLPLGVRLALLPWLPVPQPGVHDEFSYLLAADTFTQGRLANPPHPHWQFFETIHVLQEPTYMSMHPPGAGLVLALGIVVLRQPWAGVLLSTACFLGAVYWMLLAVAPPRWALLGWLVAFLQFGVAHYWVNSYWGGSLAGLGGALLAGAYLRLSLRDWGQLRVGLNLLVAAAGTGILAVTRPWEGLFVSVPVWLVLLVLAGKQVRRSGLRAVAGVAAPALLLLAAVGGFLGYYNHRVTGDAFCMPHFKQRQAYATAPVFVWQKPAAAPEYRHPEIRKFYLEWEPSFENASRFDTLSGWASQMVFRLEMAAELGPLHFLVVLPALFCLWRYRPLRLLALPLAATLVAWGLQRYMLPHYAAPACGVTLALLVLAARRAALGRIAGCRLFLPIVVAVLVSVSWALAGRIAHDQSPSVTKFSHDRARLSSALNGLPGRHLVFVLYSDEHDVDEEWVYNAANIDGARIVWARYMTRERRQELLAYYPDRTAWVLEPDTVPARLLRMGR